MNEDRYKLCIDGELMARGMNLDTAIVLLKALMEKYYYEPDIFISIQRQADGCCDKLRGDKLPEKLPDT